MGNNTEISWCHATFNPWWGCTKISPGCTHCYADTLAQRWGMQIWGPKADRRFFGADYWKKPLAWNAAAVRDGVRRRVFCASMADVFERHLVPEIDAQLQDARARLFAVITQTPQLDWLLLTKRPELVMPLLHEVTERLLARAEHAAATAVGRWVTHGLPSALPNVWIGTSTENQQYADQRIPELLAIPAVVRFLSAEPLLGPIDLYDHLFPTACSGGCGCRWPEDAERADCACAAECCTDVWPHDSGIHWIIVGGESGPQARPMDPDWARSLRDQCAAADLSYFFKQRGEWDWDTPPLGRGKTQTFAHGRVFYKTGKQLAGDTLDGRQWHQFPRTEEEVSG